ncbi:MAG: RluA family pseudouridine synthase [Candidatus Poribacteria bacterium]|nr:RluA family pseudouridine synthase [Candidatus Poribacteria bacterium]
MAIAHTYPVAAEHRGTRLDQFIETHQTGSPTHRLSRTYIQKLIREGAITVNGKASKPGYKIRTGDQIAFTRPAPRPLETPRPEHIPLDILYEDSSLIVINKPAGMVVHPAGNVNSGTLVNALLAHCRELPGIGGVQRPGIVHRLDKDTSGVLVAAKTDYAHRHLSAQFEAHTTERHYYAVICGVPPQAYGTINARITRSRRDRRKMTVTEMNGRRAVTHYRVLAVYGRFALLELTLETGRIHQIRAHLSHIGHPVTGDSVYGGGEGRALHDAPSAAVSAALTKLNRQALHAHTLGFDHPTTNERRAFSAPMPTDMQQLVEALKQAAKSGEPGQDEN